MPRAALKKLASVEWVNRLPSPFCARAFSELAACERSGPIWIPSSSRHILDVARVNIFEGGPSPSKRSISSSSNVVEEVSGVPVPACALARVRWLPTAAAAVAPPR